MDTHIPLQQPGPSMKQHHLHFASHHGVAHGDINREGLVPDIHQHRPAIA